MYSCPSCGGKLLWDITNQNMKCNHCENTMTVEEADKLGK